MTDTATESKHTVTIEDAGPCLKKLHFEIPAEAVDEKLGDAFGTIQNEAALPGFRKGRAPKRLIEKRFGSNIRDEAKQQLVAGAYSEAIKEHDIKVIGEPSGEGLNDVTVESGKPMTFELEIEVVPDFDLPEFEGIKVLKPDATVPGEMIDSEIDKIKINEGSLDERETPEPGDYITGKGIMVDADGNEHYNIDGAVVRIPPPEDEGKGMILGVLVDDFDKQFGLPKPGETATVKATGPEQHEVEDIRGKDLTVTFEVTRVDRIVPAEMVDIVAKFGMTDEEQLRQFVESRLDQRMTARQRMAQHQQIKLHLLDTIEMELPERLTANQAARALERKRLDLMYRGVDATEIEEHIAELRAASAEQATRNLKQTFILARAAEQLEIQPEPNEVQGLIAQMASERGMRPEKLQQELVQNNRINHVVQQVRDLKTVDAILAKAEIEDVSAEEYDKLMAEKYGEVAED